MFENAFPHFVESVFENAFPSSACPVKWGIQMTERNSQTCSNAALHGLQGHPVESHMYDSPDLPVPL